MKESAIKMNAETLNALILVQSQINDLTKDENNPFFKSKYVPLPAVLKEIKPILNDNGFFLCQEPSIDEQGREILITRLMHRNGQEINCIAPLKIREEKDRNDPQKYGSAITYMRRYSLTSLLGIAEDDDDGNHAAKKIFNKTNNINPFIKNVADQVDEAEIETIYNFLGDNLGKCNSVTDLEIFKQDNKKSFAKLKRLSEDDYNKFILQCVAKKNEFENKENFESH